MEIIGILRIWGEVVLGNPTRDVSGDHNPFEFSMRETLQLTCICQALDTWFTEPNSCSLAVWNLGLSREFRFAVCPGEIYCFPENVLIALFSSSTVLTQAVRGRQVFNVGSPQVYFDSKQNPNGRPCRHVILDLS